MADIIVDGQGTLRRVAVDDLTAFYEEFKAARSALPRSKLDIRRQDLDLSTVGHLYSYLRSFSRSGRPCPRAGTREYDEWIQQSWVKEPILAGTIYAMQAKAQVKPWTITGGRNNTHRAANMLNEARYSYWKAGWWGFAGMSAMDFYTCPRGMFWIAHRRGNRQYGQLSGLEHVSAQACWLTASYKTPVRYLSMETGQTINFRNGEILNVTSMGLPDERARGRGRCAAERAIRAARLLTLLHDYDEEKLLNLPPEGIAAITGMTLQEFLDCVAIWKSQRKSDNSLTFPQVLFIASQTPDLTNRVGVDMTPFSNLPEQFDRATIVEHYVKTLALCFGVSVDDIWFMGGGTFGTGRESEIQQLYAKGEGEGEWFSVVEQSLNREMPNDVEFRFNTKDMQEDLTAAQTAKAWVDALMPLVEQSQLLGISAEQWKQLLVERNVLPKWVIEGDSDRTMIESSMVLKEDAEDMIAFVWEMGKLHEVPVLTVYRQLPDKNEKPKANIRGRPLPAKEAERGARVTRKAVEAEKKRWGEIPELAELTEDE